MAYLIPLYLNSLVSEEVLSGERIINLLNGNFWYLISLPFIAIVIYFLCLRYNKEKILENANKVLLFLNLYFWGVVSMYSVYPKNNLYFTVFFYSAVFFLLLFVTKNIKIPIIFISVVILIQNIPLSLTVIKYIFFWPNYAIVSILKHFPKYTMIISIILVPIFILLYFEILVRNLGRIKQRFGV